MSTLERIPSTYEKAMSTFKKEESIYIKKNCRFPLLPQRIRVIDKLHNSDTYLEPF